MSTILFRTYLIINFDTQRDFAQLWEMALGYFLEANLSQMISALNFIAFYLTKVSEDEASSFS